MFILSLVGLDVVYTHSLTKQLSTSVRTVVGEQVYDDFIVIIIILLYLH